MKEFAPVAQLAPITVVSTVNDATGAQTFDEVVTQVRVKTGEHCLRHYGCWRGPNLAYERMRSTGDLPFLSVPYPGSAKLLAGLKPE